MLIDVILLLIVVFLVLSGYRRGLLLSLMGLLTVIICCLGGAMAQQALTPTVSEYLQPKLENTIQQSLENYLTDSTQNALNQTDATFTVGGETMTLAQLTEFLERLGLDVEGTVSSGAETALGPVIAQASAELAEKIVEKIAGALIFFAAYLILYLLLHNVALAVNVVDRVPVVHTLNRAGGGALGLLESLFVMTVAAAVLSKEGLLPEDLGPISQMLLNFAEKVL